MVWWFRQEIPKVVETLHVRWYHTSSRWSGSHFEWHFIKCILNAIKKVNIVGMHGQLTTLLIYHTSLALFIEDMCQCHVGRTGFSIYYFKSLKRMKIRNFLLFTYLNDFPFPLTLLEFICRFRYGMLTHFRKVFKLLRNNVHSQGNPLSMVDHLHIT